MSIADRMASMAEPRERTPKGGDGADGDGGAGGHSQLHPHGDGSYHTITSDGQRTEHPHIGHALMHMAAHHEGDGKHMHVHQDGGGGHTSHHVAEDGKVQGPHDHENIEALKDHMGRFLDEEANEWSGEDYGGGGKRAAKGGGGHESLYG